MANDEHLTWLVRQIEAIAHVTRLRIHTRLPVVIPQRITQTLSNLLSSSRLKVTIVFHINHPNEIDKHLIDAVEPLRRARIPLFNQSVLLKDINNCANTLAQLSEKLFDNGIQPYYLHLCDAVQRAAHFDIPESEAIKIVKEMMTILPGFLMPKAVREIGGESSKTPLSLS